MAHLKFVAFFLLFALIGCNKSTSSDSGISHQMPVINEQSAVRNGCLNIEAIQGLFNTNSNYPGLEITTDFQPDSKLSNTKALFHTNAAFGVRNITTSDIFILINPVQVDCATISAKTVSGENLNFTVTSSSPGFLSFFLQKSGDQNIPQYRIEGLEKKLQPIRYDIQILSSTHLRVITTYKSFDANCRSGKLITSTIQRDYIWSQQSSELPAEIALNESFYNRYLSTLIEDDPSLPQPYPQVELRPGYINISVDKIRNISLKAVREELKRCTN